MLVLLILAAGAVSALASELPDGRHIDCPDGTSAVGAAPPAGTELRCERPDGTIHGPSLSWYEDGSLMSHKHLRDGVEHGRQRSWWPNGQLMMDGVSVEGHRYQGFRYWDIHGEPAQLELTPAPQEPGVPSAD